MRRAIPASVAFGNVPAMRAIATSAEHLENLTTKRATRKIYDDRGLGGFGGFFDFKGEAALLSRELDPGWTFAER